MKRFILHTLFIIIGLCNIMAQIKVGVLLPLEENSDKGRKMVEFYQGVLMAVDSVKAEGTSVDVYAWHSGNTIQDINNILENPEVAQMDIIIGPGAQSQAITLSRFCQDHNIRHVMPFAATGVGIVGKPLFYQVTPSYRQLQNEAARQIMEANADAQFVFVNQEKGDERSTMFQETIRKKLSEKGKTALEIQMDGADAELATILGKKKSILITNSTSLDALNSLLLKAEACPSAKISLCGYPEWMTYAAKMGDRMAKFKTTIFTSYYRDPKDERTTEFDYAFITDFGKPMMVSFPRYGAMGFDVGYYFLHGYATLGDNLEKEGEKMKLKPYQNPLKFTQVGDNDGMINNSCILVKYE